MFCTPLSVLSSVRQSVRPCAREYFMFPRYFQYPLIDFRRTFVIGASWDKDELIMFWGQKSKVIRSRSYYRGGGVQHSTQRRVQVSS